MSTAGSLLADRVYRFCCDAIGAPEHLQIAELIKDADKLVLTRQAAVTIRDALDRAPWRVEQNLDFLPRPSAPRWYEWPSETRAGHGGGEKAVTGCLVVPHPEIDTVVTMVTAWVGSKRVARHSYGSAMVDTGDLASHAYHARTAFSEDASESIERIMNQIAVAVPLGFQDEIGIMFNWSEGAMEGVMRDSTAEIPLVMAIMLAENARGGLLATIKNGYAELSFGPPAEPTMFEKACEFVSRTPSAPFTRCTGFLGGTTIRW